MYLDYSQKIPCLILIDCMKPRDEAQNQEIREALQSFQSILVDGSHLTDALDICIMSCGEAVNMELDFTPGNDFRIPDIRSGSQRNLNTALNMALTRLDKRCLHYRECNIRHTPPILLLVSDGLATDGIFEEDVLMRLRQSGGYSSWTLAVMALNNADHRYLERCCGSHPEGAPILGTSAAEFRDVMPSFWRREEDFGDLFSSSEIKIGL